MGERIGAIAVHRSKVYMGMGGGLCEFDPSTEQFRLLASSRAIQRRSKLDGGRSYGVKQIVSDPRSDCLWITVGGGPELTGIWRYDLAEATFERRVDNSKPATYRTSSLSWIDNDLFFLSPHGWQLLDTRTGTASLMTEYVRYISSVPPNVDFLRVGDHIIQGNGRLYSPDGKMHDLGLSIPLGTHRRILEPISNGFMISAINNHGLFSAPSDRFLVFTRTKLAANRSSPAKVP